MDCWVRWAWPSCLASIVLALARLASDRLAVGVASAAKFEFNEAAIAAQRGVGRATAALFKLERVSPGRVFVFESAL